MEIQLIRNATIKVNYGGIVFLIDPYFADSKSQISLAGLEKNPLVGLPIPIEQIIQDVDYVLISHLHMDHFDEAAQNSLPRKLPVICQPEDAVFIRELGFEKVSEINDPISIGAITITRTECQHGSGSILPFMGVASGFVFQHAREKTLYWCGDTIWYEGVKQVIDTYKPEVIVCHGGGNRFRRSHNIFGPAFTEDSDLLVMDTGQIIRLCNHSPGSRVIATHLGALDHETISRIQLREDTMARGVSPDQLLIPMDGEILNMNETFHSNFYD